MPLHCGLITALSWKTRWTGMKYPRQLFVFCFAKHFSLMALQLQVVEAPLEVTAHQIDQAVAEANPETDGAEAKPQAIRRTKHEIKFLFSWRPKAGGQRAEAQGTTAKVQQAWRVQFKRKACQSRQSALNSPVSSAERCPTQIKDLPGQAWTPKPTPLMPPMSPPPTLKAKAILHFDNSSIVPVPSRLCRRTMQKRMFQRRLQLHQCTRESRSIVRQRKNFPGRLNTRLSQPRP